MLLFCFSGACTANYSACMSIHYIFDNLAFWCEDYESSLALIMICWSRLWRTMLGTTTRICTCISCGIIWLSNGGWNTGSTKEYTLFVPVAWENDKVDGLDHVAWAIPENKHDQSMFGRSIPRGNGIVLIKHVYWLLFKCYGEAL